MNNHEYVWKKLKTEGLSKEIKDVENGQNRKIYLKKKPSTVEQRDREKISETLR